MCSSLRCISSSPGNWQTSKLPQQGRVLSSRKIDFQTTLSSRSQLELSAGKPFTSSSANQTPRQELRTSPLQGAGLKGSATSEGQNDNSFCRTKVFFKASAGSLVSQLHAREKWRRCGSHKYQKLRLECTQFAIDRNWLMASQTVKQYSARKCKIWKRKIFFQKKKS